MSDITSPAYPVVTDNKDSDQFAIVRNGQLQKITRGALKAYIEGLAPNQFINLDDVPGSYVGQQGKGLVVNSTEDGMEFAPTTSSNFLALTDTPSGYGGNATRLAVVNSAETGLEFVNNSILKLQDAPSSYSGASEYVVRVNTAANALEFVQPSEAAPPANSTEGFFDYDHGGGSQNYTATGTFVKLINDTNGPQTLTSFAPPGVTDVYDETNNQFDFSELSTGDQVQIRTDIDVTTTVNNQDVSIDIFFDNGANQSFRLASDRSSFKAAGTFQLTPETRFFIGEESVKDNPVEVQIRSDANLTIDLIGYAVFITRRGAV